MARRIELKTVLIGNGAAEPATFSYGEMALLLLANAPPGGGGLSLDEVIRSVDVRKPIQAALAAGADHVTLSESDYKVLLERLAVFRFTIADEAIAEFGLMIRNAPEIGTEEAAAPAARPRRGTGVIADPLPN